MKHWPRELESLCSGTAADLVPAAGLLVGWVPVRAETFVDEDHWVLHPAWQGLGSGFVAVKF